MTAKPTTTRMYSSDFMERMSRVHPATPFVTYVPLLGWVLARCVARPDPAPHGLALAGLVAAGLFAWTLTEYALHRWVFHWNDGSEWGERVHFLLHGVHHDFPNDKDRLVMPLGASVPLAVVFYAICRVAFGATLGEALFVGMGAGYLVYDGTHYAVHHFKQRTRVGKWIKKHHMLHHFADHGGAFGVSSPLWDYVFGTRPRKKTA